MTLAGELENLAPYEKIVNNTYAYKSIENQFLLLCKKCIDK